MSIHMILIFYSNLKGYSRKIFLLHFHRSVTEVFYLSDLLWDTQMGIARLELKNAGAFCLIFIALNKIAQIKHVLFH